MVEAFAREVPFKSQLHYANLLKMDQSTDPDAIGFFMNEHLKMSGAYWCIGSLKLLRKLDDNRKDEMIRFIQACQHDCGGFGGNVGHDPHITSSLYALLILAMFNSVNETIIDTEKLVSYVKSLQNPDGSFKGDYAGEIDTRFSYCAVSILALLNELD